MRFGLLLIGFWSLIFNSVYLSAKSQINCTKALNSKRAVDDNFVGVSRTINRLKNLELREPWFKDNPHRAEILSMFALDNLKISMATGNWLRSLAVAEEKFKGTFRFKNQFETGVSGGLLGTPREAAEIIRLGLSRDQYKAIPIEERPKYAYLQFKKGLNAKQSGSLHLSAYGEDIWIFKTQEIADKSTMTVLDSFRTVEFPTDNSDIPELRAESLLAKYEDQLTEDEQARRDAGVFDFHYKSDDQTVRVNSTINPHHYFLPINSKTAEYIIEPILSQNFKGKNWEWNQGVSERSLALPFSSLPQPLDRDNFYEVQIMDPHLTIDKVDQFIFTKTPPEGEFLDFLLRHQIRIFSWLHSDDGKALEKEPKVWLPNLESGERSKNIKSEIKKTDPEKKTDDEVYVGEGRGDQWLESVKKDPEINYYLQIPVDVKKGITNESMLLAQFEHIQQMSLSKENLLNTIESRTSLLLRPIILYALLISHVKRSGFDIGSMDHFRTKLQSISDISEFESRLIWALVQSNEIERLVIDNDPNIGSDLLFENQSETALNMEEFKQVLLLYKYLEWREHPVKSKQIKINENQDFVPGVGSDRIRLDKFLDGLKQPVT